MTEKPLTIAYVIFFFHQTGRDWGGKKKKKALGLHLSQLFVELSGCTHLKSSSNVTLSLLIVKIAGKTIWLGTSSVWMF